MVITIPFRSEVKYLGIALEETPYFNNLAKITCKANHSNEYTTKIMDNHGPCHQKSILNVCDNNNILDYLGICPVVEQAHTDVGLI